MAQFIPAGAFEAEDAANARKEGLLPEQEWCDQCDEPRDIISRHSVWRRQYEDNHRGCIKITGHISKLSCDRNLRVDMAAFDYNGSRLSAEESAALSRPAVSWFHPIGGR